MTDARLRLAERLEERRPRDGSADDRLYAEAAVALRAPAAAEVEEMIEWLTLWASREISNIPDAQKLNDVIATLRRLSPAQAEEGWRPIERAPPDMPLWLDYGDGLLSIGKFEPPDQISEGYWRLMADLRGQNIALTNGKERPRRWKPLPSPPSAETPHVGTIANKTENTE